ncbi:glycosyltransferase|uniref:Glycosyltransferase n=1 Tax=Leuconostoc lactis TaxID=1246 RepID=A0A6L7AD66_LEULA|nr:glycosyltransferase [Leuconostoc lactis]
MGSEETLFYRRVRGNSIMTSLDYDKSMESYLKNIEYVITRLSKLTYFEKEFISMRIIQHFKQNYNIVKIPNESLTSKKMFEYLYVSNQLNVSPTMFVIRKKLLKDNNISFLENVLHEDNSFVLELLNQKNSGQGAARNKGIEVSSGEYIYFFDGDDIIENTLFQKAVNAFVDSDVDVFFFSGKSFGNKNIR